MEGDESNPFAMFGDFNPFLQRGGDINEHYNELLQNLKSEDPGEVMMAVSQLSMELSVAQEDTMSSFPVDQFIVALVDCLHNAIIPDIPMHATMCITNLVDIFPNVGNIVVSCGGIAALCNKLGDFEFIDMAEHAIKALEKLSYENAPSILKEGGFATILNLLDFFETGTQKTALSAIVNSVRMVREESVFMEHVLPLVPIFINHLYYKGEDLLFTNEKALEFFICLSESVSSFSIDSIERAKTNFELLSEHGLVNALVELMQNAEQFMGQIFRLLRLLCQFSCQNTKQFLEAGAATIIDKSLNASDSAPTFIMEALQLINTILPKRSPEDSIEQERVCIYKEYIELLRSLGQSILPFILHVHERFVSKGLKSIALDILDKLLLYLDKDLLLTFISPTEFSGFLAELLGSKEATTVKTALQIVKLVSDKIPEQTQTPFVREGVVSQLHKLTNIEELDGLMLQLNTRNPPRFTSKTNLKQFLMKSGIPPDSPIFEHILGQITAKRRLTRALSVEDEEEEDEEALPELKKHLTEPVDTKDPLEEAKQEIVDLAGMTIRQLNYPNEMPHILNDLRHLNSRFAENGRDALEAFTEMLRNGITSHELSSSNFVDALWTWLTTSGSRSTLDEAVDISNLDFSILMKRISILFDVLGARIGDGTAMDEFLKLLGNIIKFHQRYNILLHEPMGGSGNPGLSLRALAQKIRLKFTYVATEQQPTGDLQFRHQFFLEQGSFNIAVDQYEPVANIIKGLGKIRNRNDLNEFKNNFDKGDSLQPSSGPSASSSRIQSMLRGNFANAMSEMGLEMEGNEDLMKEIHAQTLHSVLNQEEGYEELPEEVPDETVVPRERVDSLISEFEGEIIFNKAVVPAGSTIFESLYKLSGHDSFIAEGLHTIEFRIIPKDTSTPSAKSQFLSSPPSLLSEIIENSSITGVRPSEILHSSLRMLKLIFTLTQHAEQFSYLSQASSKPESLGTMQFVNAKLCALASRQLQDMLSITRNIQPDWIASLAQHSSFLFSFSLRTEHLKAAGFGGSRSMYYFSNKYKLSSIRILRQKINVPRENLFEAAQRIMHDNQILKYGMLDIEYQDEEGTGVGPTLEFYSLLSKQIRELTIWRNSGQEHGLFPSPLANSPQHCERFEFIGRVIAKAIYDDHMVDLPLSSAFWKVIFRKNFSVVDLHAVDKDLASTIITLQEVANRRSEILSDREYTPEQKERLIRNLNFKGVPIHDLSLVFTLPGYDEVELKPGGQNEQVTIENLSSYCSLVAEGTLNMNFAAEAFREGFTRIIPIEKVEGFTGPELEYLICGADAHEWTYDDLFENLVTAHGYNKSSQSFLNLIKVMLELKGDTKRMFLSFVTGSPRLPSGGFKALSPSLTVVKKDPTESGNDKDTYLPSVMTCQNYLKLPDYSSIDVMRSQLRYAFSECSESFHLS